VAAGALTVHLESPCHPTPPHPRIGLSASHQRGGPGAPSHLPRGRSPAHGPRRAVPGYTGRPGTGASGRAATQPAGQQLRGADAASQSARPGRLRSVDHARCRSNAALEQSDHPATDAGYRRWTRRTSPAPALHPNRMQPLRHHYHQSLVPQLRDRHTAYPPIGDGFECIAARRTALQEAAVLPSAWAQLISPEILEEVA
jgi:hypothetical protein